MNAKNNKIKMKRENVNDNNVVFRMPPKRSFTIPVIITKIERGKPKFYALDDDL